METVFLSIGSNLGDRLENLQSAIIQLQKEAGIIEFISTVYETEPWEMTSDHLFLNVCVQLKTSLSAHALLNHIKQIEFNSGRSIKTSNYYQDRIIDIDILFYGSLLLNDPNLIIPHPHFSSRKFVLYPLLNLLEESNYKILNFNILDLLLNCPDKSEVRPIQKSLIIC